MAEDRGQALPTGPWQAQSVWPAGVPRERLQQTSLLLPSHREGQPLCADSEQLILDLSLSPILGTHQLPVHMRPIPRMDITFCAHSRAAHLDPSTDGRQGRGVN